jgi:ApbE superfamily uncharacterized protein (UPF0280 family)
MVYTCRETTKFTSINDMALITNANFNRAFQHQKTFIAQRMHVKDFTITNPAFIGVIEPYLKLIAFEPDIVRRDPTCEKGRVAGEFSVVEYWHVIDPAGWD